ncbi:K02A2.6-like [Cordylochernes scorpioides]|uniref:K02A2.6-like n=1 Tax=Cordylochernes scorpioides TaxID=51811 RepID=A0ABY6K6S7_9ARAC|nr:K02A2.6-like [Cordylochernes scorpioides]
MPTSSASTLLTPRILNVNYHNPNNNNYTHHNVIPLFQSIIPPNENDFRNFNSVEFDEKLSPYEKSDLIKLIKENKEAFAAHKMDIGHIKADPIRIKLTSQTPISLKPFRPSFSDNIEIKRQIEELLKYNVIRPSYSSYASPAMLVNKRNEDESRFCLPSDSRHVRVWRRRGEMSNPAAIVERPTVRQRGIMVWGAIAYDSRSPLLRIQGTMTAQRYLDDVLRPVTLPYLQGGTQCPLSAG